MCADKMRRTAPINITFSERENPTASKLTALNTQTRAALAVIELAVGDIWNQGGDSLISSSPLYIPNLARAIGSRLVNQLPFNWRWQGDTFRFYDHIGTRYSGKTIGRTLFKPSGSVSVSTAGNLTTLVANGSVDSIGDYYVSSDGEFILLGGFDGTEVVYYTVDTTVAPFTNMSNNEGCMNVIPHPSQDAFTGCRISFTDDKYYVHIPPRRPVLSHGYANWPTNAEFADSNNNGIGTGSSQRLYQSTSVDVVGLTYIYKMPDVIYNASHGDVLPKGFIYLYDTTTNTIISDVVFTKVSGDLKLQVESSTIDFSDYVSYADDEASYSASPFLLITVGMSVADFGAFILDELYKDRSSFSDTFISQVRHRDLLDNVPTYSQMGNIYLAPLGQDVGDDHIHYLSRVPMTGLVGGGRDVNKNAMLTDLILGQASDDDSDGVYVDEGDDSVKVRFGGTTDAYPYMYKLDGNNYIVINCDSGLRLGVGIASPGGFFHVRQADSGATALAGTTFVIEDQTNCIIQALTTNAGSGGFIMGDSDYGFGGGIIYDHSVDELWLYSGASARVKVDASGNVGIGTGTWPGGTNGKVLVFGDNGGDPTPGTDTAGIFAKDDSGTVEMYAVDEADNVTKISPHDPKTGEWIFYSKNLRTGIVKKVNMEKLVSLVEKLSGESLMEEWTE